VNVALSPRQPGSTLKPFTYVTAFSKGWSPATLMWDVPTTFPGGYRPNDFDNRFPGPMTVRNALAQSRNIPAIEALQFVSIPEMLSTAHKMGIQDLRDPARYGLSVTLGGGEVKLLDLTYAYAAFANTGRQVGAEVPADRVAELVTRAPLGRLLRAIREDELAVQALGKNPEPYKLQALALGAGLAGLGGSLYAQYVQFVDPTPFTLGTTIFLFLLIVLGGLGNHGGSIAAAFVLLAARESLRFTPLPPSVAAPLQQLVFSLLLVALVIYRPWGLLPEPRLRSGRAAG